MGVNFIGNDTAVPPAGVVLKKLYKDEALTQYDVFAFDALDPQSWPSQVAPTVGSSLLDISPVGTNNASFNVPGSITFNGGFQFSSAARPQIILPAAVQSAASSLGNIQMFWLYVPATTTIRKLYGWLKSGTLGWGLYSNNVNLQHVLNADGGNFTINFPAAGLYLICTGRVADGVGGFLRRYRIYNAAGLVTNGGGASGANSVQPASATSIIGEDGTFSATSPALRAYRARVLDVGTTAGIATAAWFDALCDVEFNLNKTRPEWNVA